MVILGGKIAAPSAHRFGLGGIEGRYVVLDGFQVLRLGIAVAEEILDRRGPQHVGAQLCRVETDCQRLSHLGHHRKVEQLRDVHLVVEPAPVGSVMRVDRSADLPLIRDIVADMRWRLGDLPGSPLLVSGPRAPARNDHPGNGQNEPEQLDQPEHQAHGASMPPRAVFIS